MINFLKKLWEKYRPLTSQEQIIKYLSESTDRYDLERRERNLMRRGDF